VTPLFVVHKPGRQQVELYQDGGKYRVVALALANGHVAEGVKPLPSYDNLTAEQAIEALAAVLARKTRRTKNGGKGAEEPPF
jgi:hypothetical protein